MGNAVPGNYNPETFKALRYGIDSLYVSYPGVLSEGWDHELFDLKDLAQSDNEIDTSLAQVVIGEHIFEVRDRGRGHFAYVLVDNCYHMQASNKNSRSLPLAYAQISSAYLASVGVEQAEQSLRYIVNTLGWVHEPVKKRPGRTRGAWAWNYSETIDIVLMIAEQSPTPAVAVV